MNRSESIGKIAPALLAAQKNIGAAAKDQRNPFFNSRYADLGSVMEACKECLNDQDIAVLQPVGMTESGQTYVETILLHKSGEYISDRMFVIITPLPAKKDGPPSVVNPQAQGSAITYARRYSLQSMCFIPAEDDDGNKASNQNGNNVQSRSNMNTQNQQGARPQSNAQQGTPAPKTLPQPSQAQKVQPQACIVLENGEELDQGDVRIYVEAFIQDRNIVDNNGNLVSWELWVASYLQLKKVSDAVALLAKGPLAQALLTKVWNGYLLRKSQEDKKDEEAAKITATV